MDLIFDSSARSTRVLRTHAHLYSQPFDFLTHRH